MKIQVGEIYLDRLGNKVPKPNKTKKYLSPVLKEYGNDFTSRINSVFKVAIGVGDIITTICGHKFEKHLFILLDTKIADKYFRKFIEWVRDQPMYEEDYVYGNIQKSTFHMVVLKFPEKYYDSFETFKRGEYSKMYNTETVNIFFANHPKTKKVLIKDNNYKVTFVNNLNEKFGTSILPTEWEAELDFPPQESGEIFNHHLKK